MPATALATATAPLTVTLTRQQWDQIRTAILCHSCDVRLGITFQDRTWADQTHALYDSLKGAMGD